MTIYRNCVETGETEWGVTTYRYDVRDTRHYAPPTTATSRTTKKGGEWRGPPTQSLPVVLMRVEGNEIHFPDLQLKWTLRKHGRRTLVSVHKWTRKCGKVVYRVVYDCDCGARDHIGMDDWRKAITCSFMGQCTMCANVAKRRGESIMPSKAQREAKQQTELSRLPYRMLRG